MADKVIVDSVKLHNFASNVLQKAGVPKEDAEITAHLLVTADIRGIDSHGVGRLGPVYIRRIKEGAVNLKPQFKIISHAPSTAIFDGDRGLGFVVGYHAMTEAMQRAEKTGAGFVSARNSTHCGAGSVYSLMALPRNLIGIAMTTGGLGMVAPGSVGKGVGINVISVAVPTMEMPPFVLDMATTVVAGGKFELALRRNQIAPVGWAVDNQGQPLTHPKKYRSEGALLPLGGTPLMGSYKGFALAVLVDILASILGGSVSISDTLKRTGTTGCANQFFGALKIDGFMPVDEFKKRMDALFTVYHNLPKAPGVERISLAGEMESDIENQRRQHGIPLDPPVAVSLQELAKEFNIEYDL